MTKPLSVDVNLEVIVHLTAFLTTAYFYFHHLWTAAAIHLVLRTGARLPIRCASQKRFLTRKLYKTKLHYEWTKLVSSPERLVLSIAAVHKTTNRYMLKHLSDYQSFACSRIFQVRQSIRITRLKFWSFARSKNFRATSASKVFNISNNNNRWNFRTTRSVLPTPKNETPFWQWEYLNWAKYLKCLLVNSTIILPNNNLTICTSTMTQLFPVSTPHHKHGSTCYFSSGYR